MKNNKSEFNWEGIPEEYKYAAMDANGDWYAYTSKPVICDGDQFWGAKGYAAPVADWKTSLLVRP